jgi:hypothetical protein
MTVPVPGIPDPGNTITSLRETVVQMKQALEVMGGSRATGNQANAAICWQDLVNLGLIKSSQIPNKP